MWIVQETHQKRTRPLPLLLLAARLRLLLLSGLSPRPCCCQACLHCCHCCRPHCCRQQQQQPLPLLLPR
jgi:hypothetical protein